MLSDQKTMDSRNNFTRHIAITALLLIGIGAVYLPRYLSPVDPGTTSEFTFVTDLDFWQRTERERTVTANAHFDLAHDLSEVPLQLGQWYGEDRPNSNEEVELLLDPEQYIRRLYYNAEGQYLWLSMLGGRSSRPFHAPDICYDADGWQYNLSSYGIELDEGGEIWGLWLDAEKDILADNRTAEHIVYYFYLFPNGERDMADGIVIFKLTSPRYGTAEETLGLHADFVKTLFTHAY